MNVKNMMYSALFAALTAVASQISIPLPFTPIPINLATLVVVAAGGLLGAKWGSVSQCIYLLLGLTGVPVFAKFQGGLGTLLGPTGGYLVGYLVCAWICGMILEKKQERIGWIMGAMTMGIASCYLLGTIWFMVLTKNSFTYSLMQCVVPFLAGDAVKIIAGSLFVKKVKKSWRKK